MVQILLDNRAQVDILSLLGTSALMHASQNGHVDVVKILLDNRAQVNLQSKTGTSALMYAIQNNRVKVVKILLDSGAQVDLQDNSGRCSYIYANLMDCAETILMLQENISQKQVSEIQINNEVLGIIFESDTIDADEVETLQENEASVNLENKGM